VLLAKLGKLLSRQLQELAEQLVVLLLKPDKRLWELP
jgi:hypothetical protein